uniref:WD_REPEATS_REGION domain-containing protein n=1 Tax=Echinostoma caproni TaxID=27848 RepID=A0A183B7Y0_9TREM
LLKDSVGPGVCRDWDSLDEKEMLTRLKEQYRADRCKAAKSGAHSPRVSGDPQHQTSSHDGITDPEFVISSLLAGDIDVKRPAVTNPTGLESTDPAALLVYHDQTAVKDEPVSPRDELLLSRGALSPTSPGLSRVVRGTKSAAPTPGPTTLVLGDLASLTVANESDASGHSRAAVAAAMDNLDGVGDLMALRNTGSVAPATSTTTSGGMIAGNPGAATVTSTSSPPEPVSWTAKYTLRSHFDAIRAIAFHATEPTLVTASEDHTLKLWNLSKTVQAKKSTSFDVEPVYYIGELKSHDFLRDSQLKPLDSQNPTHNAVD